MRSKNIDTINNILNYINDTFFSTQEIPSVQDIADHVGIAKSSASRYLSEMEQRGMIFKSNTFYGLETVKIRKAMKGINIIPIVGEIACDSPILAEENIESYLTISGSFLGEGEYFALRAYGDSMINAGIDDGDYVVIRKQSFANEGQIVVAMVNGGDCTLKRYYLEREKKRIRLHPENNDMEDMYFSNIAIQGVAVKVIKNIKE